MKAKQIIWIIIKICLASLKEVTMTCYLINVHLSLLAGNYGSDSSETAVLLHGRHLHLYEEFTPSWELQNGTPALSVS